MQILRFGVALGLVERDVTPDLKGALKVIPRRSPNRKSLVR